MYRLNTIPNRSNGLHEIADFVEWNTLISGSFSQRETTSTILKESENDNNEGCEDDETFTDNRIESVFNEISRRELACNGGYPFSVENKGTNLQRKKKTSTLAKVYSYLLLSSRMNMKDDKVQAGIDGTEILERLSREMLKNYLGKDRAKCVVFGTASKGGFKAKVNSFCEEFGEGIGFNPEANPGAKKDDGIDVVAWKPFKDRRTGKICIFAQCKTGTNWRTHISKGAPEKFCKKWLIEQPSSAPLAAFIISESANPKEWRELSFDTGLLFDRCRIVDYCPKTLSKDLLGDIDKWSKAAIALAQSRGIG